MNVNEKLSDAGRSILFSNLAKGCEKQYRKEEAELLGNISDYYRSKEKKAVEPTLETLAKLAGDDLDKYARLKEDVLKDKDRGGLRALVWSEKVSRITESIITRYLKKGNELLEDTDIHVCEVCGFVYIGVEPPEVCPVCKVPRFRITKVRR